MTIQDAVRAYPGVEIDLFLEHILHKPREFLFLHGEHELTRKQTNELTRMISRRRKGEPVAYILGYKDFYGLRFKVNKNVLIPRPETEWIIDKIKYQISNIKNKPNRLKILDIGTGSGCISITLAKLLSQSAMRNPQLQIIASDISPAALAVARSNAKTILGIKSNSLNYQTIRFVRSDLFEHINGDFDIIVANLPYVPKKVYRQEYPQLKYEPKQALIDPKKDFDIYRKFLQQAPQHVHGQSVIYLEIDPLARTVISDAIKRYLPGWKVKFYKDFRGLWRYAVLNKIYKF